MLASGRSGVVRQRLSALRERCDGEVLRRQKMARRFYRGMLIYGDGPEDMIEVVKVTGRIVTV